MHTPQEILEQNTIKQVQNIDRNLMKDLYVFRMAMARLRMPGARRTAFNAAQRVLDYLEHEFGGY